MLVIFFRTTTTTTQTPKLKTQTQYVVSDTVSPKSNVNKYTPFPTTAATTTTPNSNQSPNSASPRFIVICKADATSGDNNNTTNMIQ